MPSFLSEILGQLRNIWAQLSGGQRATMLSVLLAAVVGFAALTFYVTRPDYVSFMGASEGEDRARIIAALDEASVDYQIKHGVIRINSAQRSQAETALDKNGLRGDSSAGSESGGSAMMLGRDDRDFALQLRRQRRVEAQLRKISDVQSAMVTVYEPKGPQLLRKGEPRSASVLLTLKRSGSFAGVAANAKLIVSNSLGVNPERVHVSDSIGRSAGSIGTSATGWSPLLTLEAQTSRLKTMQARLLLENSFPGKATVAVTAEYDNKIVQRRKSIVSEDKIVVGETSYKTKDSTAGRAAGDPNGVGSSTASAAAGAANGAKSSSVDQVDKRYQPIIGEESTKTLAPDLKRLSVSLAIDKSLAAQEAEIIQQVKNAIGWVEGRDAAVSALKIEFEEFSDLPESGGALEMAKQWAPLVGQLLSVLLVVFFLKGLLKRTKPMQSEDSAAASAALEAAADAMSDADNAVQNLVDLRKEIESVVSEDPASVSRLLESWLSQKEPA